MEHRIDLLQKYWEGRTNRIARYWMYLRNANSAMNEFRSYGYILTGLYLGTPFLHGKWLLTLSILGAIVIISIPLMIFFGRWLLYKAQPAQEYAQKTKGSPYQYKVEDSTIEMAANIKFIKELFEYYEKNPKNNRRIPNPMA